MAPGTETPEAWEAFKSSPDYWAKRGGSRPGAGGAAE